MAGGRELAGLRWSNVPATQVEFDDGDEAVDGNVHVRDGKKHLRMAHEAKSRQKDAVLAFISPVLSLVHSFKIPYLVIRSSMLRGSRMNVGSTTRLKSAPGRS